ncbi:MAG: asparagine synthase (glutamine-hydrolyzing) [Deltaproteobacteria bacterium]|nr:asparagine synthase (glutamine-hydrolyzing) [Deltaproteobacteria bacterium]
MCGLAGIFAYRASAAPVDPDELLRIREHMQARGPDGEGIWVDLGRRIGLAHRRLAIIDLSPLGAQPMSSRDGMLRVVFNGEIYNYRELRRDLEAAGHQFQSQSDTEVLLHLYQEYGRDLVQHLRGMYAFALWDGPRRGIFLARDPFGIKPLYYADHDGSLRFASQVKALLAGGRVDTQPEPAGHVGFFLWGFVPEPYTLHHGVRALAAGSALWLQSDGEPEIKSFCDLSRELAAGEISPEASFSRDEALESLRAALRDSVAHHLLADVPIGVFLSGGLDSTTLAAVASDLSSDLHSFTLGVREFRGTIYDETELAAAVARRYGTIHQTRWISREDFGAQLPHILEAMDQPSIDGVNTYFVAREAAAVGLRVALSGLGGDELFGGYPSFHQLPRLVKALSAVAPCPVLGRVCRRLLAPIVSRVSSPKYAGVLEYGTTYGGAYLLRRGLFMPWELDQVLDPDMAQEGWRELRTMANLERTTTGVASDHLRVSALEMTWYMRNMLLRDADWAGMAHSLEIRVPLVDINFLRTMAPLLARPILHKNDLPLAVPRSLPPEILNRPKTGFLVPAKEWVRQSEGQAPGAGSWGWRGWARKVYQSFTGAWSLL